jgi:toxin FitB
MPIALDTSVAVPLVVQTHRAHEEVRRWWAGRDVVLSGHALAETYSVLTRLPGDLRLTAADASKLISTRFAEPLLLSSDVAASLPETLSRHGIVGGAVYDAMIGLAAIEHRAELATRDMRARATYEVLGARIVVVA